MSALGSIHQIFETPLPENPTLLESLTWSQIKQLKSIESSSSSSFTEIFGELHFKESPLPSPLPSPSSSSSPVCTYSSFSEINHTNFSQKGASSWSCDINQTPSSPSPPYVSSNNNTPTTAKGKNGHKSRESLQLCTEGLGFESSYDVEELKSAVGGVNNNNSDREIKFETLESEEGEFNSTNDEEWRKTIRSMRGSEGSEYPPPISCIGRRTGKPWVSFRSYRRNGRFVLKEIRIPTQELLHAHREDGRLKLHLVQPNEQEDTEEDEDEEEEEGEGEEEEEEEEDDDDDDEKDYDDDQEDYDDVDEDSTGKEIAGRVTDQVREEK